MSPRSLIAVTAILLGITLGLVSPSVAKAQRMCCTTFSRKPINPELIRGYMILDDTQTCRTSAYIFFTRNNKICVKKDAPWLPRVLAYLSDRLKNEAKPNSAKKGLTPSFSAVTASFSSTTEAITNSTDFYW